MSRFQKSVKNTRVALIFYLLRILLTFFSRKIFIDCLGEDLLGLNSVAVSILSFLNLAELGVGVAVSVSLYKPLFENNRKAVNEIMSVQAYLYRNIAYFILAVSVVLMFFLPAFFQKTEINIGYVFATFLVLLFGTLLSYIYNYKQVLLLADQKAYVCTYVIEGIRLLCLFLQMIYMLYLPHPYEAWLVLEFLQAIAVSLVLKYIVKKMYPWLQTSYLQGKRKRKMYPGILFKIKQLLFHKIGGFTLKQSTQIFIYGYTSLAQVTVYGNYTFVTTGITVLMNSVFNGIGAGVGNLVAENDKERTYKIYWELFNLRFWLSAVFCFMLFSLTPDFIRLWLGERFVMPHIDFVLLLVISFIAMLRGLTDHFLDAHSLFKDIWAPITEVCLNVGLSILLGYYWGLTGVLWACVVSSFFLIFIWKPIFLFRAAFKKSPRFYFGNLLYYSFGTLACGFFVWRLSEYLPGFSPKNYGQWLIYAGLNFILFALLSYGLLYLQSAAMRQFTKRIWGHIKEKTV